ncbi:MAG TPA: hypothetical protein VK815_06015 [Candidatus Acidoferrales bacterium]|jgi:hypothetical protein|nr:hypothetical protein [Candidatus Acidoferrales bacterium]
MKTAPASVNAGLQEQVPRIIALLLLAVLLLFTLAGCQDTPP